MKENIKTIIKELEEFNLPTWESMPNIDLYMDQVFTYLDRELSTLKVSEEDKILTTSMINNYVKGDLVASPIQKKYNKEHLSKLLIISSIKQIMSISDIAELLNLYSNKDTNGLYKFFIDEQKKSIVEEISKISSSIDFSKEENDFNDEVLVYIIRLAIHAQVQKILAQKLLNEITTSLNSKETEEILVETKEKTKKKEKKEKTIKEN